MQRHGLILADNGSNWYFTGTSEPGWDNALLDELKTIPAGAFEAVDTSSLMADPNSGRVASGSAPPPTPSSTATTRGPHLPPPAATARPVPPTTARPTTTTRPKATATTQPPTTTSTPGTTATTAPTTTTTPPTTEVAAPLAAGAPTADATPPHRSGRGWMVAIPAGLALAVGIGAWRRRRRA
jgi:hypothetical protein